MNKIKHVKVITDTLNSFKKKDAITNEDIKR